MADGEGVPGARGWTEKPFAGGTSARVLRDDQRVFGAVVPVGSGNAWLGSIRSYAPRDPRWVRSKRFDTEEGARAYVEAETASTGSGP